MTSGHKCYTMPRRAGGGYVSYQERQDIRKLWNGASDSHMAVSSDSHDCDSRTLVIREL